MATSAQATTAVANPSAVRGRFIWHDLMTTDPDAAKEFYSGVVGWGKQDWPGTTPPYTMWMAGETMVGGVMQLPDEAVQMGSPPHWLTYIDLLRDSATLDVDSIAEDIADAERDLNAKTDSKREALARARLSRARARLREARKQRRELRLALLLDEE